MAWHVRPLELADREGNGTGKWRLTATSDEDGGGPYAGCQHEHASIEEAVACEEALIEVGKITGFPHRRRAVTNKGAGMEFKPHVVRDTGEVVLIRKVSPVLAQELRRRFPPPTPPMNRVDYGDGRVVEESNPSDPAHEAALADYNAEMEMRARLMYVKVGTVIEWTDAKKARVAELRATMAELGVELDGDDKVVYVSYIAVGTPEDYNELVEAITRRSQPTEEAVAEAVETFRA